MRASNTRDLTPPADPALPSGSPVPSSSLDLLRPADPGAQAAVDALGLAMPTGFADLIKGNGTDTAIATLPQLNPAAAGLAIPAAPETGTALPASARVTPVMPTDVALAPASGDADAAAPAAPIPHADPPGPDMAAGPETAPRSHQPRLRDAAGDDFSPAGDHPDNGRGSEEFARPDIAEPLQFRLGHHNHSRAPLLNSSTDMSANLARTSDELTDFSSRLRDQATHVADRVHEITLNPLADLGGVNHWNSDHALDDPTANNHGSATADDHGPAHDGPSAAADAHDAHPHADAAHALPAATANADDHAASAVVTHAANVASDHDSATAVAPPADAAAPSLGPLIESGARAILLQSDAAPSAASPRPDARPGHGVTGDGAPAFTPAFAPHILSARDQLASAMATATPETAGLTTLTPAHSADIHVPTLGADVHAMHTPLHAQGG